MCEQYLHAELSSLFADEVVVRVHGDLAEVTDELLIHHLQVHGSAEIEQIRRIHPLVEPSVGDVGNGKIDHHAPGRRFGSCSLVDDVDALGAGEESDLLRANFQGPEFEELAEDRVPVLSIQVTLPERVQVSEQLVLVASIAPL
jgi:hypothetical protein